MKLFRIFSKLIVVSTILLFGVSCDEDFNNVGGEVLGDVNFEDEILTIDPIAYNKVFDRIQTNNLPGNLLGIYNDPAYGSSSYQILSQVRPTAFNPFFGEDPELEKVVITLPYFSTQESTEDDVVVSSINTSTGEETETTETKTNYSLDSIYGGGSIKLSIYKSDYFLSDYLPGEDTRRVYFSDELNSFVPSIEGTLLYTTESFTPSAEEVVLTTETVDESDSNITRFIRTRLSPRLRLEFTEENAADIIDLFQSLILDNQNNPELSNSNNFLNFFRGIYFKVEPDASSAEPVLLFLNLDQANIVLSYKANRADLQDQDDDNDLTELIEVEDTYQLDFTNNIVNSIETNFTTVIPEPNTDDGDELLYLKGGIGSYAIIDLFGKDEDNNGVPDQLENFRENEWLINEANLKFYVNRDLVPAGDTEPERVYLFNPENGAVIIDYLADGSTNETSPINSKINHLARIDSDENGTFYKIRLTRHITQLLNEESDITQLAVAVSKNVNITSTGEGSAPNNEENDQIMPFSSIISHEGTILYGNGPNTPEANQLKLEIFYTESNN